MFQASAAGCIPIVDPQGKLAGMVRRKDILAYYAGQFPATTTEST